MPQADTLSNRGRQGGFISVSVVAAIVSIVVTGGGLFFYAGQTDKEIEAIDRRHVERTMLVDRQIGQLFQNDSARMQASAANAADIKSIRTNIDNMLAERTRAWAEADRRDAALSVRIEKLDAERVAIAREISTIAGQFSQIMDMLRRLLDKEQPAQRPSRPQTSR